MEILKQWIASEWNKLLWFVSPFSFLLCVKYFVLYFFLGQCDFLPPIQRVTVTFRFLHHQSYLWLNLYFFFLRVEVLSLLCLFWRTARVFARFFQHCFADLFPSVWQHNTDSSYIFLHAIAIQEISLCVYLFSSKRPLSISPSEGSISPSDHSQFQRVYESLAFHCCWNYRISQKNIDIQANTLNSL